MPKVVISEFMDEAAIAADLAGFDTLYDPGLVDRPEDLAAAAARADALIVRNRTQVRGALLDAARDLTVVGRLGVGLDNIDLPACRARGIAVYPATGANDGAVAEYVIASALLLLRGAYGATARVAAGTWPRNAASRVRMTSIAFCRAASASARRAAISSASPARTSTFPDDAASRIIDAGSYTTGGGMSARARAAASACAPTALPTDAETAAECESHRAARASAARAASPAWPRQFSSDDETSAARSAVDSCSFFASPSQRAPASPAATGSLSRSTSAAMASWL